MHKAEPNSQEQNLSASQAKPFSINNAEDYKRWREAKLDGYPEKIEDLMVDIGNPSALAATERKELFSRLNKANIAIYKCTGNPATKSDIQVLSGQLGLNHLDGNLCADQDKITSLQVVETGRHKGYIPYSNKQLSWHTDGYYNPVSQTVRAIVMHCAHPAAVGGENMYLDPDILYIHIRDQDPLWIEALMQPDAMIIPANIENGKEIRAATKGPVFSVDKNGYLHMRYSARTRNIEWAKNGHIKQATDFITEFLASDSPFIFRYRLNENEGVISNNVLHNRTAFEDDVLHKRLLYRARFYERVSINK